MTSDRPIDPNCPNNGALYMLKRGFHVFPLKRKSKDPKYKGWQTGCRAVTAESVTTYMGGENWGVHPGLSGHFVIDIDVKNGKQGDKAWAALCEVNGGGPKTFTVRTPTKGLHLYFRGEVEGNAALAQDVDVRTTGGYVVAPGSEIDGQLYKVIDESPIAAAPQWLLDALGNRANKPAVERVTIAEVDKASEIERAIAFLRDAEPAVEGRSGDAVTLKVALGVRDLGMSEEKCLELMLAHYDSRCAPPWGEDGLRVKVENAYKYAQNSLGARTVEAANAAAVEDFGDVPMPAEVETKAAGMSRLDAIISEGEFDLDKPPARTEPVLWVAGVGVAKPGDLVVLQAKVKAGKSAALGAMIASIIGKHDQGHDYLGFRGQNLNNWPVLHFDTEQSPEDHYDLIKRTLDRAGVSKAPKWLRSICLTKSSLDDRRAAIFHFAEMQFRQHGGLAAMFIDGIGDLCKDPNDGPESNQLVDLIYARAIRYACPVIVVLHENPGSETGKTRGHLGSQLERKAASNLRLEKDEKGISQLWGDKLRRGHIPKGYGPSFIWSDEQQMHVSTLSTKATKELEADKVFSEEKGQFVAFLRGKILKTGESAKATELNKKAVEANLPFGFPGQARRFAARAEKFLEAAGGEFRIEKMTPGVETSPYVIKRVALDADALL